MVSTMTRKPERADRLQRADVREDVDQLLEHPRERVLQDREDRERVESARGGWGCGGDHAALPGWVASRCTRRAARQLMYVSGTGSMPPSWHG